MRVIIVTGLFCFFDNKKQVSTRKYDKEWYDLQRRER